MQMWKVCYCQNQIELNFWGIIQKQGISIIAKFYTIISGDFRRTSCVDEILEYEVFSPDFQEKHIFILKKKNTTDGAHLNMIWFFKTLLVLFSKFSLELA